MISSVEMIVQQEGSSDRFLDMLPGMITIGRAEDNDLVLADIGVSRRHARITVEQDDVRIEDLGSGNGTFFRGSRIQDRSIGDGDAIVIDPFVLRFKIVRATEEEANPGSVARPRLVVTASDVLGPESIIIPVGGGDIGRSEECDIILPDAAASRVHCRIEEINEYFKLVDGGSANGVFVNGMRVEEQWLNHGDEIRVGDTFFQFQSSKIEQAHSITEKQPILPEVGEDTTWSRELTMPDPESFLPTDADQSKKEKSGKGILFAFGGAFAVLLVLFAILLVLVFCLVWVLWAKNAAIIVTPFTGNFLWAWMS